MIGLWLGAAALAWETVGATWAEEDLPLEVWISSDLAPLDDAAAEAAMLAALATWEAADCGVSFDYRGRVDDAVYGGPPDGRNVVFFVTSGWPAEPALSTDERLAVDGERILEGDIGLNGEHFDWATSGADGVVQLDVRSGVTHELGHILGLSHSDVPGATLNAGLIGHPDANTLEADDLEGLCTLYERGDAGPGDPCTEARDCADDLTCLLDGNDRYCAPTCDTDADCPTDWTCEAADGASVCARPLDGGCGCSTGNAGGAWVAALALGLLRRRSAA